MPEIRDSNSDQRDLRAWTLFHCSEHSRFGDNNWCPFCKAYTRQETHVVPRAELDRLRAENERLREAHRLVWILLHVGEGETHQGVGRSCGEDACPVCLAMETANPRRTSDEIGDTK